jgi:hypothetical protein
MFVPKGVRNNLFAEPGHGGVDISFAIEVRKPSEIGHWLAHSPPVFNIERIQVNWSKENRRHPSEISALTEPKTFKC